MAIDFKSKFDELFGAEEARASAPTLRDVAPGLVQSGGSRFSSKELNPRRTAVSARDFRNPRVRSQEGAFERGGAVAQGTPSFGGSNFAPSFQQGGTTRGQQQALGGPGGGGIASGDVGPGPAAGGAIGTAVGDSIAGNIGLSGLSGIGSVAAQGLGLGASIGQIASAVPGAFTQAALAPLGLANTVGGGLAAAVASQGTADLASDLGFSPEVSDAFGVQGVNQSPGTLSGNLLGALSQATGIGNQQTAFSVNEDLQTALLSDIAGGLSPGETEGGGFTGLTSESDIGIQGSAIQGGMTSPIAAPTVGALGASDVGLGNAPAAANTPGAVSQSGLVASGFSAPQGETAVSGNFGQAGLGSGGSGSGSAGVSGVSSPGIGGIGGITGATGQGQGQAGEAGGGGGGVK